MKVAFISNAPIPYHTQILNALARLVDLDVLYMSRDDRATTFRDIWGEVPVFRYSFYRSRSFVSTRLDMRLQISLGTSRIIGKLAPDAVLVYSWNPIAYEPVAWAHLRGRRTVMWSESTCFSGLLRGRASTAVRRTLIRQINAFVASGSKATEYLQHLGAPSRRIVTSCLPSGMPQPSSTVRADTPARPSFLYVGRLIAQKRPVELIEAFATVRQRIPEATLTVVGEGALAEQVRAAAAAVGGVNLVGHREASELAECYRAADVLVLPAVREVWGLVVNEALSHGLRVVATDQVGSAFDLVACESGTIVPADDWDAITNAMEHEGSKCLHEGSEARMRHADCVRGCTPEEFARDIQRALNIACAAEKAA